MNKVWNKSKSYTFLLKNIKMTVLNLYTLKILLKFSLALKS